MTYVLLALAIATEVVSTVALKVSDGMSRLVPSVVVVVGYLASFVLLALVLKRGAPVAVVYAVWAGVGTAAVALIGAGWLGERLSWVQVAGVALVVVGVIALEAGASVG